MIFINISHEKKNQAYDDFTRKLFFPHQMIKKMIRIEEMCKIPNNCMKKMRN